MSDALEMELAELKKVARSVLEAGNDLVKRLTPHSLSYDGALLADRLQVLEHRLGKDNSCPEGSKSGGN